MFADSWIHQYCFHRDGYFTRACTGATCEILIFEDTHSLEIKNIYTIKNIFIFCHVLYIKGFNSTVAKGGQCLLDL